MDPNEIKNKAQMEQRYKEKLTLYRKHKSDHQKSEREKIKGFFSSFFLSQEGFKINEINGQVIAEIDNNKTILLADEFQNRRDQTHAVHFKVKFSEGTERLIGTQTTHNYENKKYKPGQKLSQEDQWLRDIEFYDAVISGKSQIMTHYYLKESQGKREIYESLEELFKAI